MRSKRLTGSRRIGDPAPKWGRTTLRPDGAGARAIELALSQRYHPIWTKLAASSLIVLGLAALLVGGPWLTLVLVLYGAGIGLESIARGTLPLVLVGPRRYPIVMGRIALPNLMVQAASPLVGSMLLGVVGSSGTVTVLTGAAVLNVLLSVGLALAIRRPLDRVAPGSRAR